MGWKANTLAPLPANRVTDTQATSPTNFFLYRRSGCPATESRESPSSPAIVYFATGNSDCNLATSPEQCPQTSTYDGGTNIQESVVRYLGRSDHSTWHFHAFQCGLPRSTRCGRRIGRSALATTAERKMARCGGGQRRKIVFARSPQHGPNIRDEERRDSKKTCLLMKIGVIDCRRSFTWRVRWGLRRRCCRSSWRGRTNC